jgi:hypothetical protein
MSNLFKKALASLKDSKSLDTILTGSGFLDEGTYSFKVNAIDISDIDNNKVTITYQTPEGQQFTDKAFAANRDGTGLSKGLRMLVSACLPDTAALAKFFTAVAEDFHSLEMLTGMEFQATLKRGPGFQVHALASGGYAAFDGKDPATAKRLVEEPADDIKAARDMAKAAGHTQSYVRIESVKATHAEANLAAFERSLASKGKPRPAAIGKAI